MQSPSACWTPHYRHCSRHLGVNCSTVAQRWRATPILTVCPVDDIAGVPLGTELLTPAPDALSEEPPFQARSSAFLLCFLGGEGASGGESEEMELRPCVVTQDL